MINSLGNYQNWSKLSAHAIQASSGALLERAGSGFEWLGVSIFRSDFPVVLFKHSATGLTFNLIPGGEIRLGLSEREHDAIQSLPNADGELLGVLKPAEIVKVEPFLMSQLPLLEETVTPLVDIDWSVCRPDFQPLSGDETGLVPIYLSRQEAELVLEHYQFSFPTEAQWEYAVRGGSENPFWFGTELLPDSELSVIFDTDFREPKAKAANTYGLIGMLVGGWCKDSLQDTRWHGMDSGPPHVIRGGAAIYWPWQNTGEWQLALSAMRRSSDDLEDGTCSAHVVVPIDA